MEVLGSHLLKTSLKNFERNLTSLLDEHNYIVVLPLFGIVLFFRIGMKMDSSSPVATVEHSKFAYISSTTL